MEGAFVKAWQNLRYSVMGMTFCISMTHQLTVYVMGLRFMDIDRSLLGQGLHLSLFSIGALLARTLLLTKGKSAAPHKVVCLGMGLTLACMAAYNGMQGSVWVSAVRVLHGLGFGLAGSVAPLFFTFSQASKDRQASDYSLSCAAASLVGPAVGLWVYQCLVPYGFGVVSGLVGGCALTAALLAGRSRWVQQSNTAVQQDEPQGNPLSGRMYGILVGLLLVTQILGNFFTAVLPAYAKSNGSVSDISFFFVGSAVVGLVVRHFFPHIRQRIPVPRMLILAFFLYSLGVLSIQMWPTIVGYTVGAVGYGVANAVFMTAFYFVLMRKASPNQVTRISCLYLYGIDLGVILAGSIWSFVGVYTSTQVVFGVAVGLALACAWVLTRPKIRLAVS